LAFEKFAIFFSFMVTFILTMILLAVALVAWQRLPTLQSLRDGLACQTITGLNSLVDDLEDVVITQTIHISQSIPVRFDLPLDRNVNVQLTQEVKLTRPTSFILPAGGGYINGTVTLVLPKGQDLPIHMNIMVPVNQQLPVEMDVPVAIPLKETELGSIIGKLKGLLEPLQLRKLEKTLGCSAP